MLDVIGAERILADVLPPDVWPVYAAAAGVSEPLLRYCDLLLKWNRVINLTALRTPEEIVQRHVAESVCCAALLPPETSVLDLGSGAGFPGIPVQLVRPELRVTLAESHKKKAMFLREVVRELDLRTEVFAGRAQELPDRSFGWVCLRAVDPMQQALAAAAVLARDGVIVMGSAAKEREYTEGLAGWSRDGRETSVGNSVLYVYRRM